MKVEIAERKWYKLKDNYNAPIAQLVEQIPLKDKVVGSIPTGRTKMLEAFLSAQSKAVLRLCVRDRKAERVPVQQNWSRAADTRKIFDGKFLLAEDPVVLYLIHIG